MKNATITKKNAQHWRKKGLASFCPQPGLTAANQTDWMMRMVFN